MRIESVQDALLLQSLVCQKERSLQAVFVAGRAETLLES